VLQAEARAHQAEAKTSATDDEDPAKQPLNDLQRSVLPPPRS
jgi:hypothetical protein